MMTEITKELLEQYVRDNLLNKSVLGDYELYCYNKDTFFNKNWDNVTKACRGLVLYKGEVVNHPFPKIFNLDEVDDVSSELVEDYLKYFEYHVYHKVNGHLTIVDYIPENEEFLVHTKGSLQSNEMNDYDQALFRKRCSRLMSKVIELEEYVTIPTRYTFLFESINPTDPHTLYDQEVERYGDDTLVLLGGYMNHEGDGWQAFGEFDLEGWGAIAGTPVAQKFNMEVTGDVIEDMFKEKDTEGYVIWFPELDLRVKIKTTDYWKLRFRKDLSADLIIDKFVAGGNERLWSRYPEEVADQVVESLNKTFRGFTNLCIAELPSNIMTMTRKEVGLCKKLTPIQKFLTFLYKDGIIGTEFVYNRLVKNKELRSQYQSFMDDNLELKDQIHNELIEFIEKRE